MSKVTVKDQGWRELLARAREIAKGATVKVGILDDAPAGDDGVTLLKIAVWHEFGVPGYFPQRSFIRATVDERALDIAALTKAVAVQVFKGDTSPTQGLNQIGAKVASWVVGSINAGIDPPNAPSTIARKRSSKPLVDEGQLKSAITWKVE